MVTNFDVGDDLPLLVYLSSNSLLILKEKMCQHEWKKNLEIKCKIFPVVTATATATNLSDEESVLTLSR